MSNNNHMLAKTLITLLFGLFLLSPVWAGDKPDLSQNAPSFWKVEGKQNTVWLFGSVHVLTKEHYPLADKVEKAFADSPNLVVEVDVVNVDPLAMQQLMAGISQLPAGTNLKTLLGKEQYARASELATASGYNLDQMSTMRPWLVTMMLAMAEFSKMGYTPDQGVETYFLTSKEIDDKSIIELETIKSQLDIFAEMNEETEVAALMQTLEELPVMDEQIGNLIKAWEAGSLDELEDTLLESFADYPELYKRLVIDRNHNWIQKLTSILDKEEEDHFVVVGALHMVGEEGVANLLRKKGYKVTKQ